MSPQWILSKRAAPPAASRRPTRACTRRTSRAANDLLHVLCASSLHLVVSGKRDAGEALRHYVKIKISLWLFIDLNLPPYPLLSSKYQAQISFFALYCHRQLAFSDVRIHGIVIPEPA